MLAHLPEYQHRAVISVLDEMKWMLRDEIAFALTKTLPSSRHTLEFVRNHVQSSVGKSGSAVETVDLNFVFGTQVSLDKFRENFLEMEVAGFILREEGDFCYLDTGTEADTDPRTRDENLSGSRRRLQRQARAHQLSPVKEALAPGLENWAKLPLGCLDGRSWGAIRSRKGTLRTVSAIWPYVWVGH